jgi:hypothetical protein
MTYSTPRRRTILQFSQIRLTDGRTFMMTPQTTIQLALLAHSSGPFTRSRLVDKPANDATNVFSHYFSDYAKHNLALSATSLLYHNFRGASKFPARYW